MSQDCARPLSEEVIVDYLVSDLGEAEARDAEIHLFRCSECASRAAGLAGLAASVALSVPPVLTPNQLDRLDRAGRVSRMNPMEPEQVAEVLYPPEGRLLVHRLGSGALRGASRVDVNVSSTAGELVAVLEDVPFDSTRGEVLLACQRHFADRFPHDTVFAVVVEKGGDRRLAGRYSVLHRLEQGAGPPSGAA